MEKIFKKFFGTKTSRLLTVGLVVCFLIVIFVPVISHAQAGASGANHGAAVAEAEANGGGAWANITMSVVLKILTLVVNILSALVGLVTGLSGYILDFSVNYSITNLATNLTNITTLNTAWQLVRDLCNMSFIFILIYHGIMIVFSSPKGNKKVIVSVIIAAVLINFSLFFTKLIIDASNVIALSFYNSILSGASAAGAKGISDALTNDLKLSSIFAIPKGFEASTDYKILLINLGGLFFQLTTIFVFLAAAVMFMIRYVMFIFLLIISPLGYMASVIPGLKSIGDKYWGTLLGQAYFAPIFMVMTWITLTLASNLPHVTGTFGEALTNPSIGNMDVIMNFFIVIGLMILTLIVSKNYATQGGLVSNKWINTGTSLLGGAVFGTSAALGRRTIGATANDRANDEELKKKAAAGDKWAQLKLKTYRGVAGSSFDARQAPGVQAGQKLAGVDFGKGNLIGKGADKGGGFAQTLKDKKETEKKYAESLKPSDEAEAAAKAKLSDPTFVAEEKAKLDANLAKTAAEYENKKKVAETEKVKAEAEKTTADKAKEKLVNDNKRLTDEISALEKEKIATKSDSVKALITKEIEEKEKLKTKAESELKIATDTATKKVELFKETEEKIKKIEEERKAERETAMSQELKDVIKLAGGSKANEKILKSTFDIEKFEKDVESAKNERVESYAKALETKKTWTRLWMGTPKINKQAAVEVRKANKGKTAEQLMKDVMKSTGELKDEDKKEEKTEEKKEDSTPKAA